MTLNQSPIHLKWTHDYHPLVNEEPGLDDSSLPGGGTLELGHVVCKTAYIGYTYDDY